MEQKTKIEALEGRQDLTITRTFDLSVELVYKAHQEAELVAQWMGTKVIQFECHNLGNYRFETEYNGNIVFAANGCFHQVVPNEKIIRTFEMEQACIGASLEILSFEKLTDSSSKLTMHIIYQSEQHRAEQLKMPFAYGLNMAHDKLQEILYSLK
ncbi:MAG TPA: SRPBCC domain-containing protein [Niabella sp.]|nr:SRPBCC domain-containing protein [Niabella sp.]HOZ97408.1 SRPBCC domain-containing protein [Niabella sp.]HQW15224.1 SRPBCC domain-containing protein [Niabella sp.]HQX20308.1 SRPBCC domain-containing protein [Niabella sp.]HQX42302.1 SRPBCC domain-containing protein [Niabella sp.]